MYRVILCCMLLLAPCAPAAAQEAANAGLDETFHVVKLARGTELNLLISKRKDSAPVIAALLFPGYPGVLKISNEGGTVTYGLKGNFLIRARRHLNTDKIFTVMVDCPRDQWYDCGEHYRRSEQHAADVAEVAAALKQQFGAQKIYVIGTSYGTISSSFLAKNLAGKIDGAIHSSTFTDSTGGRMAHGASLVSFDWSQTTTDQLFVHHKDDPCHVTRYAGIVSRKKDIPLITVQGAVDQRGDACEAYSQHGFVGREKETMAAIGEWIVSRKLTPLVGAE
jgi:hypothetical protein